MTVPGNRENPGRPLSTADLVSAARGQETVEDEEQEEQVEFDGEAPMALFTPELTETYRSRWVSIQSSFVDDPRQAVRSGDELVAEVMTNLANTFADERQRVEAQLDQTGEGSTENLRLALRRYRSFFERLLSL